MATSPHTPIAQLGEFGLIDRFRRGFAPQQPATLLGIGDDAAVLDYGGDPVLLSTDMLVEGIHFDLSYVPLPHLGYKAIAVNVSDIAAMNGLPCHVTVSLALSNRFSVEAVEALYEGIRQACHDYGVDLVGGDTTASPAGLAISVTAVGTAARDEICYRKGAQSQDVICVTGDLGAAYVGLQVLAREKAAFLADPQMQPQLADYEYVVGRQLRPRARLDFVHELRALGVVPHAMIDISDGLASEVLHLCQQSDVGALLYEDKIPVDNRTGQAADEFRLDPATCALNGGEDYELLFTLSVHDFEKIRHLPDALPIGIVKPAAEGARLLTRGEQLLPLQAQGWQHFQS